MINNVVYRLRDRLSVRQKRAIIRASRVFLAFLPHRHSLNMLGLKHGTTKWGHGYMEYYQRYFSPIRRKRLNILEIGVGGYRDPKAGGESLRMWQEYFPRAMIHGIDVVDKSCHDDKRIKTFVGSQNDPAFLDEVATEIEPIDIVIDDGSHNSEHVMTSFRTLFPRLSEGGIYVIEDLSTSYWPRYGGDWRDLIKPGTSMSMLKGLVDGLNYQYIPNRRSEYTDRNIVSIHFYPQIVFIFKGDNKRILSQAVTQEIERASSDGQPSHATLDTPAGN